MTKVGVRDSFQLSVVSVWLVGGLLDDCWRIGLTAVASVSSVTALQWQALSRLQKSFLGVL